MSCLYEEAVFATHALGWGTLLTKSVESGAKGARTVFTDAVLKAFARADQVVAGAPTAAVIWALHFGKAA